MRSIVRHMLQRFDVQDMFHGVQLVGERILCSEPIILLAVHTSDVGNALRKQEPHM
jgi:hypothetical protein